MGRTVLETHCRRGRRQIRASRIRISRGGGMGVAVVLVAGDAGAGVQAGRLATGVPSAPRNHHHR